MSQVATRAAVLLLAYSGYRDVQAAALFQVASIFLLTVSRESRFSREELPTQTAMVKNIERKKKITITTSDFPSQCKLPQGGQHISSERWCAGTSVILRFSEHLEGKDMPPR